MVSRSMRNGLFPAALSSPLDLVVRRSRPPRDGPLEQPPLGFAQVNRCGSGVTAILRCRQRRAP